MVAVSLLSPPCQGVARGRVPGLAFRWASHPTLRGRPLPACVGVGPGCAFLGSSCWRPSEVLWGQRGSDETEQSLLSLDPSPLESWLHFHALGFSLGPHGQFSLPAAAGKGAWRSRGRLTPLPCDLEWAAFPGVRSGHSCLGSQAPLWAQGPDASAGRHGPALTARRPQALTHPVTRGVADGGFRLCPAEFTSRGFRFYSPHVATFCVPQVRAPRSSGLPVCLGRAGASRQATGAHAPLSPEVGH